MPKNQSSTTCFKNKYVDLEKNSSSVLLKESKKKTVIISNSVSLTVEK